jgi:signal transduction histidine kinase
VLYAVLLVATFAIDLVVLTGVGRLMGERMETEQALVVAVFVVAAVYAPLRHRLWRLVRARVVGERDDPYAVVAGLARRLEESPASDAQLLEVARAVATAFRSPYVGVEIRQTSGGVLLAEHGQRPPGPRALPITYRDEQVGRLLLSQGASSRLRPTDERLLADVVRQAAAATRADQLATELQHSRERLVTAVEDERRRLRRELHDGLGPTLAAVASRIDTARITASKDPAESERMLRLARDEVTGMLTEVRRLVHGLRPPALDDVGLVRALRRLAEQIAPPGLSVRVEAPEDLTGLSAAVEVAAYRIGAEALTNVVRHAGARLCTVRLAVDSPSGCLLVEVADDGCGIDPEARAGVGLVSVRERAEELGGRAEVTAAGSGGTRVRALLPLPTPTLAAAAPRTSGTERG